MTAAIADGEITPEEAGALDGRIGAALDGLHVRWTTSSAPRYRAAALIGRDTAAEWIGTPLDGWNPRADLYHRRAMAWLVDPDGPLTAVRADLRALVHGQIRRVQIARPEGRAESALIVGAGLTHEQMMTALYASWNRQEFRIDNWAGRLVELANQALTDGLLTAGAPTTPGEPPQEWYAEWVSVSDAETCRTCSREALAGIRPLVAIRSTPGGDTECRARCRCVFVLHTESEVKSGKAVSLNR
jgi:hypothetical protein